MSFDEQYPADECAGCHEYEKERVALTARLAAAEAGIAEAQRVAQQLYKFLNQGQGVMLASCFARNHPWIVTPAEEGEYGTCVLCGGQYSHYGNNPQPVVEIGRCCDHCNGELVIPERIGRSINRR